MPQMLSVVHGSWVLQFLDVFSTNGGLLPRKKNDVFLGYPRLDMFLRRLVRNIRDGIGVEHFSISPLLKVDTLMMSVEGFWISKGYLLEGRFQGGIGKVDKVQKLQLVLAMFGRGERLV